jgi:hypothetical protein
MIKSFHQKNAKIVKLYSVSDSTNWKIPVQAANLINIWNEKQGTIRSFLTILYSVFHGFGQS